MKIKKIFRFFLALLFIALSSKTLFKYLQFDVGMRIYEDINHDQRYPAINICPRDYNPQFVKAVKLKPNITVLDIQSLPSIRDISTIYVEKKKYLELSYY